MVKVFLLLLGIIVFQVCSEAAPSELNKNDNPIVATDKENHSLLDGEPRASEKHQAKDNDASQSQRQKRFYDYLDYPSFDLPSTLKYASQPHYSKRDESHHTAVYGTEDALSYIFKRLHDIVRDVRNQNVPRPAHTTIPTYIPLLYIPHLDCSCSTNNQGKPPPVNNFTPQPPTPSTYTDSPLKDITTTTNSNLNVTFDNRVGLDDKKTNWGIVTSKPDLNKINNEDDGKRPINLAPIPPEEPMDIPAPPVDHGTVQAGEGSAQSSNQIPSYPLGQNTPVPAYLPSRPAVPQTTPLSSSENVVPSLCDGAIISCCNQPKITDKCFEALGCEDPTIYGSPCDPKVQLMVINKFQFFHKRRSG